MAGLADDVGKDEPTVLKEKLDYLMQVPSKGDAPYFLAVRRGPDSAPQITIEARASTRTLDELIGYWQRFDSD